MRATDMVVLEGDETGQELLEEALRVINPDVIGFELALHRFDLSLANRRATRNRVVTDAAGAVLEHGLGLKAATVTPEGSDDVGTPNRILREEIGGHVIVRTGRRIPGVTPMGGAHAPITVVRMAVGDAYGARGVAGGRGSGRGRLQNVSNRTAHLHRGRRIRIPSRRENARQGVRRPEIYGLTGLRGHAQGGDGRRSRAAPRRASTSLS